MAAKNEHTSYNVVTVNAGAEGGVWGVGSYLDVLFSTHRQKNVLMATQRKRR